MIEDVNEQPHRERSFYEYPKLYDFFHSRVLDRTKQVSLLEHFEPDNANRVLELGCGTGPLLARIEDEYDEVLGVDSDESMLAVAREKVTTADLKRADFTDWCATDHGRTFDTAVLMGGLLHLTRDEDLQALAVNTYDSLREGGAFGTFFQPFTEDVANGNRTVEAVESERYTVKRHATTALTSPEGHYTTTYLFTLRDKNRASEAKIGTVFNGRFHDPDKLADVFRSAGFDDVEVTTGDAPTTLRAVK
ncbi:class I SAM-dependent methyltransferase [Halomicrobium sp. ZPS1]|uniref:class I SAM-dependent DNA methyltransferase n=1 Tax=Halomicrobium sp. ZPS1 TaxID=2790029 RepID=UPI00186B1A1B|nr:class I SAM-dependent methyltransferase [Halomicrobium sp. ZPS1]